MQNERGVCMSEETIPLYDGEPSGAVIRHESGGLFQPVHRASGGAATGTASSRRKATRHDCERTCVCFSPHDAQGRVEDVECPVFDISKSGVALEYDRELRTGSACTIAYRTVSRQPVHVSGRICNCRDLGGGRFKLGIKLNRELRAEELKLAKKREGQDIAPGIRARPLREPGK